MRLRYQTKPVIYEVISTINFNSVGVRVQRTLYGSDYVVPNSDILRRAKENIKHKLENSSGKIVSVIIKAIYK